MGARDGYWDGDVRRLVYFQSRYLLYSAPLRGSRGGLWRVEVALLDFFQIKGFLETKWEYTEEIDLVPEYRLLYMFSLFTISKWKRGRAWRVRGCGTWRFRDSRG